MQIGMLGIGIYPDSIVDNEHPAYGILSPISMSTNEVHGWLSRNPAGSDLGYIS